MDGLVGVRLKGRIRRRHGQCGRGVDDATERCTMVGIRTRGPPDMRSVEGTRDDQGEKQHDEGLKTRMLHELLVPCVA
jgi:hypothetical protein